MTLQIHDVAGPRRLIPLTLLCNIQRRLLHKPPDTHIQACEYAYRQQSPVHATVDDPVNAVNVSSTMSSVRNTVFQYWKEDVAI